MSRAYLFFLLSIFFVISCKKKEEKYSELFTKGEALGTVDDRLHEASGLIESIANPQYFWTLNDSGNPAEVFLIDQKANIQMVCKLRGIDNRDFEDITMGAGPVEGKNYIYAADIGDNLSRYSIKLIYRFEEPLFTEGNSEIEITDFDTLRIKLADRPRDTEAILVDPLSKDIYLLSKLEDSISLYQIKFPFQNDTLIADKLAILPLHKITAGNISADGNEVLLKNYKQVYYWKNNAGLPLSKLLLTEPALLAYKKEPQGEAICWARDGGGYYTLSEKAEGEIGKLLFYKRK
ncbi:MAG: hypothetical protein ACKVOQ_02255 [Cyclobacteriaceae bacterium]